MAGRDVPSSAPPSWHALALADVVARLDAPPTGLTASEAERRLACYGPNVFAPVAPEPAWRILVRQLASVVVGLLVVAVALSAAVGDVADAVAIGVALALNVAIGFVTELRARRAVEALHSLDAPRATVLRDGLAAAVDAATLVPGDAILLEEGRAVPADARVLRETELRVNEASLTGESEPVTKHGESRLPADTALAERTNMVYKGTTVVAGSGRALVVATGAATEIGGVGTLVASLEQERTPLERRLDALGRRLAIAAVAIGAMVVLLDAAEGRTLAQLLLTGIAVAVAAVPEGLPAVVTIAMATGVRRMARRHAIIRRLATVESLGSATVVCTDKTGTLTLGEMTVTTVWTPDDADGAARGTELAVSGRGYDPAGVISAPGTAVRLDEFPALRALLATGVLANRAGLEQTSDGTWTIRGDPTEAALLVLARKGGMDADALRREAPETGELPFSSERMIMATYHAAQGGIVAYAKGAPARLVARCTRIVTAAGERDMDGATRARVLAVNDAFAARGLRVLALASGRVERTDDSGMHGLALAGLVGMVDPPAPGTLETIAQLREAGVRTIMITGDQRLTADAIARALGILTGHEETLDQHELDTLTPEALAKRVARVGAFSRATPASKLRIVEALRRGGDVVAMLGDGVNDAPALRRADVGVAMGRRGSDVAKEAAGVILADDRFTTVGAAVEEGRVIYANIRRFVFYLLSGNLAEIVVLVAAGVIALPTPLWPLQILWLNLVTDTFPALALAFEPGDPAVMRRPPRDPGAALLSRRLMAWAIGYALVTATSSLVAYVWVSGTHGADLGARHATTACFMTLALAQVGHLTNARYLPGEHERRPVNRYVVAAAVLAIVLQLGAIYVGPLAAALRTVPLRAHDLGIVAALSLGPAAVGIAARAVGRAMRGPPRAG